MRIYLYCLFLLALLSGCATPKASGDDPNHLPQPTAAVTQATEITNPPEEEPIMETQSLLLLQPKETDLVRVADYIPDALQELKYATSDNFTGAVIYNFQDIYLRYGTVQKLSAVRKELAGMGLNIKIWDGFRPVSAQFKLWEICPDDTYVANPNVGYSNHSRGFAVDLTLVDADGQELEMPTAFDDFSGKADRNYGDVSPAAAENSRLLEQVMTKHGFKGYSGEWWHYNDSTRYEVEHVFDPGVISCWTVTEGPAVPLLENSDPDASSVAAIESGDTVTVMGFRNDYALVTWQGLRGYVECLRLFPC